MAVIAEAMGLAFDEVEAGGELAGLTETVQIAAGTVEKGTVGAMRITITGKHKGKPVMRFRTNWYISTEIEADWNLREGGWRIVVEGDTPLHIEITYPVAAEDYAAFTPGLTAHRPVNAIPMVVAAEPGIRTTLDLPHVIPHFAR
jgi:2,4-diaminopentanoate dehydrogenase